MKRIDSHSFNNEVLAEINKVKTLLTKITPENVKYFDNELLRKARGVVNYPDEYKWGDSIINSIDVRTVKRLTDWMKLKKHEYILLENTRSWYRINPITEITDKQQLAYLNVKLDVPSLFDGRNSFVKLFVMDEDDKFINYLRYVNWGAPCSLQIGKTKTQINIDCAVPVYSDYGELQLKKLYVYAFCWRKK
jgi:hypothetical protein